MTMQQVRWAAQHDWFIASQGEPFTGMSVVVDDSYTDRDGIVHVQSAIFDSFQALRAWAGY